MVYQPALRLAWAIGRLPASLVLILGLATFAMGGSEARLSPIVKAVQRARPAIVNIRGEKVVPAAASSSAGAEGSRRVNGMGTGVIIDRRGYILTNFHVVDGVKEIQVTLANEEKYVARLVARDLETDLAVIQIDARGDLSTIPLGTSSDLMSGESVVAVGNAYGYEHTVTRGIISALHRAVQVSDAQFYDDLIQTDASINPGNSGGPLLNVDGEMIGVNVAVRAGAQGIGFAIPVDKVLGVASQLLASCNAKRARLGVVLEMGRQADSGLTVAGVEPDSPAAAAGLQPGDMIRSIAAIKVERNLDFQRALLDRRAGDQVTLVIGRKAADQPEEELTLHLKLAEASRPSRPAAQPAWQVLGLELRPMSAEEFQKISNSRYRGGLLVSAVRNDGPGANQGIRRGDVLVGMHVWETISLENVNYILARPDFDSLSPLKFYILRGNETLYGFLPIAVHKVARQE